MMAFITIVLERYYDARIGRLRSRYDACGQEISALKKLRDQFWMYASFERHGTKAIEMQRVREKIAANQRHQGELWEDIKRLRMKKCKLRSVAATYPVRTSV